MIFRCRSTRNDDKIHKTLQKLFLFYFLLLFYLRIYVFVFIYFISWRVAQVLLTRMPHLPGKVAQAWSRGGGGCFYRLDR